MIEKFKKEIKQKQHKKQTNKQTNKQTTMIMWGGKNTKTNGIFEKSLPNKNPHENTRPTERLKHSHQSFTRENEQNKFSVVQQQQKL